MSYTVELSLQLVLGGVTGNFNMLPHKTQIFPHVPTVGEQYSLGQFGSVSLVDVTDVGNNTYKALIVLMLPPDDPTAERNNPTEYWGNRLDVMHSALTTLGWIF